MSKRLSLRLLALPLLLAVLNLGVQVVAHYDGNSHDEAHCTCQVCHVAHAAIPQPASQEQIQLLLAVTRFTACETQAPTFESSVIPSIPRAPPA